MIFWTLMIILPSVVGFVYEPIFGVALFTVLFFLGVFDFVVSIMLYMTTILIISVFANAYLKANPDKVIILVEYYEKKIQPNIQARLERNKPLANVLQILVNWFRDFTLLAMDHVNYFALVDTVHNFFYIKN